MIFIINQKYIGKDIPKFFEIRKIIRRSRLKRYKNDMGFEIFDGSYKKRYGNNINGISRYNVKYLVDGDQYQPFIRKKKRNLVGDKVTNVYTNVFNEKEEIIAIDGILMFIRTWGKNGLVNVLFSIKNPELALSKYLIKSGKMYITSFERIISNVKPTNNVVTLLNINQLSFDMFVNVKIDGITSIVVYSKYYGIVCFLGDKIIYNDKIKLDIPDSVFLAEYYLHDDHKVFYLFLEANDKNHDYNIDYLNMKKFVNAYSKLDTIRLNYIVISKKGESYRDITKKIMKVGIDKINGSKPKTDGLVYGNIFTKKHFKWKRAYMIGIDFYVLIFEGKIYLYVGRNYKLIKFDCMPKVPKGVRVIIGKGYYVKMLYLIYGIKKGEDLSKFNDTISECRYIDGRWLPVRIRLDKKNPNNFTTAENNIKAIKNPIKLENLI